MSDPRMDALRFRGVDLCAPETHDEPWELYDYLREHDPLYWDEHNALWYVFRYDDVLAVSRDPVTFCSTLGNRPNLPADPSMIHQDGTAHAKQRGLVAKGFTPRAMKEIEASCAEIVDTLIDAFLERGHRRVAQPRVDIAEGLQVEQARRVVGAVEDEARRLVDRQRARAGRGIGDLAGVDRQRLGLEDVIRHGADR